MNDIQKAVRLLCEEKGVNEDIVMESLQTALAAAFRKDFGNRQGNYTVEFDAETGDIRVWDVKEVVEDISEEELEKAQDELSARREQAQEEGRELTEEETADLPLFNPKTQIMLSDAKEQKKGAKVGEVLEMEQEVPGEFGRMAAQTAKQVIIQKLREAERKVVFEDFRDQEHQVVSGVVQRRDRGGRVIIDLGKITGLLPQTEMSRADKYIPGARFQFYVKEVAMEERGPRIILSRSDKEMVRSVLEQEIPEIADGDVEMKGIARDPGNRSKVAVWTDDESIDPIGACIGQRGSRITTIIDALGGEKIDVIMWDEDPMEYLKQALSPAKVDHIELNEEKQTATAHVEADQFSLAIGRGGQNVRLAAELTGWKIDVVQVGDESNAVSSDGETVEGSEGVGETEQATETDAEEEEKKEAGSEDDASDKEQASTADESADDADEKNAEDAAVDEQEEKSEDAEDEDTEVDEGDEDEEKKESDEGEKDDTAETEEEDADDAAEEKKDA